MTNKICISDKCTGCSACASICPKQCINMKSDNEGFLRPVINEDKCVKCGICKKICPVNHEIHDDRIEPESFAVRNIDKKIRAVSSSGGVFSALAEKILSQKGIVIAAGIDHNNVVHHKVCDNIEDLDELRRSKYVQSRIENTYRVSEEILKSGRIILFCGTPCQIGGLKSFLGKEYPNLYTADFICHGVPSPLALEKYLEYQKQSYNSEIEDISFRDKALGWNNYSMRITFSNKAQYNKSVSEDYYLRSFIMDLTLRPSCYDCSFKQIHRISDITLADFWGLAEILPEWNDNTGVSLVLIHSEKGKALLNSCSSQVEKKEIPFNKAIVKNQSFTNSVVMPSLRKNYMKDLFIMRYDKLYEKYCGMSIISRLRRKIAKFR
ncbi:Coenzyme F420-reducing hydrogenase, beta subunit [Ruminococcus sp. YE71]|nr:Coenzyme F420 hydrogenase/dehydrogenase, beta subunit C-terminal domain [Ruminococcus sp. YE78]SDA11325.1 Coenzyme F420-reducing hydrogenase, beta subunit [Ruminococcus sp. YE78]SFW15078.1 Coenzyme F420-reducing hydrogenase, beta subunit [Ruminococcus sp. YE71]